MKNFKKTSIKTFVLSVAIAMGAAVLPATAQLRKINGIAAKVNDRVVTDAEVAIMLAPRMAELAARHPRRGTKFVSALKKEKKGIMKALIDRQLLLHEFKARGANIPNHVVEQEIRRQIQILHNGNEAKFRKQLKQVGLSYAKFTKLTKEKLIGEAMRAQHFNDAAPATPGELRAEYNKLKEQFRDHSKDKIDFEKIYIPKENADDLLATPESQLKFAEELIVRIKKGENFASLAKEYSEDAFKDKGGLQKGKSRNDISPEIGMILFTDDVGTVLGPLEDSNGYHIIRVKRKILGPPAPFSKVKKFVERSVQNRKSSARFNRFMDRLRKKAIIEYP